MLTHNQQLTVAFVTPTSSNAETTSPKAVNFDTDAEVKAVTNRVLEDVHALGLKGAYRVIHLLKQGRGKQAFAIIVVQDPVQERTLLPEPDAQQ